MAKICQHPEANDSQKKICPARGSMLLTGAEDGAVGESVGTIETAYKNCNNENKNSVTRHPPIATKTCTCFSFYCLIFDTEMQFKSYNEAPTRAAAAAVSPRRVRIAASAAFE
jgi:hypothetical protein